MSALEAANATPAVSKSFGGCGVAESAVALATDVSGRSCGDSSVSAERTVFTVALLSAVVGSGEVVLMVAVFVVEEAVTDVFTLTFKVKLAVELGPRDTNVAVTVPVPPTAGCLTTQPAGDMFGQLRDGASAKAWLRAKESCHFLSVLPSKYD